MEKIKFWSRRIKEIEIDIPDMKQNTKDHIEGVRDTQSVIYEG